MSIYQISGDRLNHLNNQMNQLQPGQIVQGKIVKIFPGNKARITLGSRSMIAQLEASLIIGERYHFQVKSTDHLLHLQVLGKPLKNGNKLNAETLLQQLGFKGTKGNIDLVNGLIQKSIPFDKKDIANAIPLLDRAVSKNTVIQLLQQMITYKLPVTNAVLRAIHSMQTSDISRQMQAMLSSANEKELGNNLFRMLEGFHTRPENLYALLTAESAKQAKVNNQGLFSLLQLTGVINDKIDFSTWKSAWNNDTSEAGQSAFSIKMSSALQGLEQIIKQKAAFTQAGEENLLMWRKKLSEAIANNTGLTKEEFSTLKQQILQILSPKLWKPSIMENLNNHPADLERIFHILKALSSISTSANSEKLLNQIKTGNTFLQAPPKDQFLMHLKHWLTASGMDYENQIATDRISSDPSLKGMLLQLMSSGSGRVQEQAAQFLHFIHGLQLSSVHETNGFLHISLQIPGQKLGLLKDINLEFESRKTESGQINPEHCRIVFDLHLENLHETLVDMHVQKRAVTITVYNDADNPGEIFGNFKTMLKSGLEHLNYQLSIVQYRKLHKLEQQNRKVFPDQQMTQGVDYRI